MRSFFTILKHTDFDRRALRQYSMQPRVMNHCRIGSENHRLYWWMPRVGETTTQRDLNDGFKVKLNFVGSKRILESIHCCTGNIAADSATDQFNDKANNVHRLFCWLMFVFVFRRVVLLRNT